MADHPLDLPGWRGRRRIDGAVGRLRQGGFERHHTLADLAIIGAIHLAVVLLWPIVLFVLVLQYFGLLPHPITF